ncbi:OmpA family protein [Beggiatoa leptomitoformis]|nr:OmpA family protein [Beggiatoa leptomitoformis]
MNFFRFILFSSFLMIHSVKAAELQNGVCFPKTTEEILQLLQQGVCAGFESNDGWEAKGFGDVSKGIHIAHDKVAVLFEFDSSDLSPDFYALLDEFGKAIQVLSDSKFIIQGHTDNIGSDSYNLWLSEQRANQVLSYLVNKQGINRRRLSVQGLGKSQPLKGTVTHQSDEERAWNRRVEFVKQ